MMNTIYLVSELQRKGVSRTSRQAQHEATCAAPQLGAHTGRSSKLITNHRLCRFKGINGVALLHWNRKPADTKHKRNRNSENTHTHRPPRQLTHPFKSAYGMVSPVNVIAMSLDAAPPPPPPAGAAPSPGGGGQVIHRRRAWSVGELTVLLCLQHTRYQTTQTTVIHTSCHDVLQG